MNNKKPSQFRAWAVLSWYAFRAQTRNPATFAFGFVFPLVFICVFGLIGNSTQKLNIGVPGNSDQNNPIIKIVEKQSFITLKRGDEQDLEGQLKRGKLSGILFIETNDNTPKYSVNLKTSSANPQEAATAEGFIRGVVDQSNLTLSGIKNPPVVFRKSEVSGRHSTYIDFALPGQIGFSLLSTSIFGTVFGLIYLKKALIFKRMFATPTHAVTLLLSQGTSRLISVMIQTAMIVGVGVIAFGFYLPNGWLTFFEILLLSAFGLVAFLGFGILVSGLVNDENAASPLANLITLPQILLSGVFFSTENFPSWVQPIANNLPLSYFNAAIRKITTEGQDLSSTLPYLAGLALWSLVMYFLATRTFKWQ